MEIKDGKGGFILRSLIAMAGTAAMMGLAYLFHFAMVRSLDAPEYGELGVLIGVFAILTVPITNLQSILSREVTRLNKEKSPQKVAFFVRKHLFGFSKAGFIACALLIGAGIAFPQVLLFSAIGVGAVFMYLIAVEGAYFQGMEKTAVAAFIQAAFAALKLGAALVFVYMGIGLAGAVASLPAGALLAFAILLLPILFLGKGKEYEISFKSEIGKVLAASILLTVFLYMDLFAVRLFFGAEEAGVYNVAAITARIIYFLAAGLVLVLMPQSTRARDGRKRLMLLAFASGALIPALAIFLAFSEEIIRLFYTSGFIGAAGPFSILSIGMFAFAAFFLLINIFWSQKDENSPLLLSAGMVPLNALLLFVLVPEFGMAGAAFATLASSVIALLGGLFLFWVKKMGDYQQIPS